MPSDFDRFIEGTFWNRDEARILMGPLSAQEWQALKSDRIQSIHDAFRQRGDDLYILPTPTAGTDYAFEYISTWWAGTSSDTAPTAASMVNDADQAFLDEELITLGGVWRYLRSRGLDYSEPFRSYEMAVSRKIGRDAAAPTLNMSGPSDRYPAPRTTIPDGNWNL